MNRKSADKFIDWMTTVRLTDEQALLERVRDQLTTTTRSFLLKQDFLGKLELQIVEKRSLLTKTNIAAGALASLLCASILGVSFELSFLGLTLRDLGRLKELILVALIGEMIFSNRLLSQLRFLTIYRRQVWAKLHGNANAELLQTIDLDLYTSNTSDFSLNSKKYSMTPNSLLRRLILEIAWLPGALTVAVGVFAVIFIILRDAWINSNINGPWNELLVVLYVFTVGISLAQHFANDGLKSRYTDATKWNKFKRLKAGTKQMRDFINQFMDRTK